MAGAKQLPSTACISRSRSALHCRTYGSLIYRIAPRPFSVFFGIRLNVFCFNTFGFSFPGNVTKQNSCKKAQPSIHSVQVIDLFAHTAGSAVGINWFATNSIFENVVVRPVYYFIKVVGLFIFKRAPVWHKAYFSQPFVLLWVS